MSIELKKIKKQFNLTKKKHKEEIKNNNQIPQSMHLKKTSLKLVFYKKAYHLKLKLVYYKLNNKMVLKKKVL